MVKISLAVSSVLFAISAYAVTLEEALASTPELAQLNTLIGLVPDVKAVLPTLKDITILAPSNTAIQKLLSSLGATPDKLDPSLITDLLLYHVINGTVKAADLLEEGGTTAETLLASGIYANLEGDSQRIFASAFGSTGLGEEGPVKFYSGVGESAGVSKADVETDTAIVHVIDTVLNLPRNASDTAEAAKLTSLIAALQKADLVNTVDTTAGITVFAPTDAAFTAAGVDLDAISVDDLTKVLQYHVVKGVAFSSDLENDQVVETLSGDSIKVSARDGKLYINDIEVAQANVALSNGVAHVLNGVLSPESPAAPNETTSGTPPPSQTPVPDSGAGKMGAAIASVLGMAAFASFLF